MSGGARVAYRTFEGKRQHWRAWQDTFRFAGKYGVFVIQLPPAAMPFLRRQRTEYAQHPANEAQSGFAADVVEFASQIRPFLPSASRELRFVDIGCGIGFSLLGMLQVYGPEHRFVAIDRNADGSQVAYGFSETPSAYNSLQLTRDILIGAGVPADRIECVDIDQQPFPMESADIVTSTFAWGFHFPVEAYLQQVDDVLAPEGLIIIDVRRGLGQEAVLSERFEVVQSWPGPASRSDRLILRRRA